MRITQSLYNKVHLTNVLLLILFVIKSIFRTVFLLVRKKNWTHTHNFKDVVELMEECRDREIQIFINRT